MRNQFNYSASAISQQTYVSPVVEETEINGSLAKLKSNLIKTSNLFLFSCSIYFFQALKILFHYYKKWYIFLQFNQFSLLTKTSISSKRFQYYIEWRMHDLEFFLIFFCLLHPKKVQLGVRQVTFMVMAFDLA